MKEFIETSSRVNLYRTNFQVTVLMLLGAIGFALYIGYTTSILQSHNASKRLYAEKYSSIKQYMLFRKVLSPNLRLKSPIRP